MIGRFLSDLAGTALTSFRIAKSRLKQAGSGASTSLTVELDGVDGPVVRRTGINLGDLEFDASNVRTVTTNATAAVGDVILVDTSAGDVTITIPAAGSTPDNSRIIIKKTTGDLNTVTVGTEKLYSTNAALMLWNNTTTWDSMKTGVDMVGKTDYEFQAQALEATDTAEWPISDYGRLIVDADNDHLMILRLDDTDSQGAGMYVEAPFGATHLQLGMAMKAVTPQATDEDVVIEVWVQAVGDDGMTDIGAWALKDTNTIEIPTVGSPSYPTWLLDATLYTLATLGMAGGSHYKMAIIRKTGDAADTLGSGLALLKVSPIFRDI